MRPSPAGRRRVPFGAQPSRGEHGRTGGDHERPTGACERGAQRLDRPQIRLGGRLHLREVVDVGEVDDPIGRGRASAQAVEVVESAALHRAPGGGDGSRRSIRTREPDDLMARADELRNHGGADEAGRAGDEHAHEKTLPMVERPRHGTCSTTL